MKCVKNEKTGQIKRVSDELASEMVDYDWTYTGKSEWKEKVRDKSKTIKVRKYNEMV
jgi:hypothetical protein